MDHDVTKTTEMDNAADAVVMAKMISIDEAPIKGHWETAVEMPNGLLEAVSV